MKNDAKHCKECGAKLVTSYSSPYYVVCPNGHGKLIQVGVIELQGPDCPGCNLWDGCQDSEYGLPARTQAAHSAQESVSRDPLV